MNERGYPAYCERNSLLVDQLISEYPSNTVFATPSGFLIHEGSPHLVKKHVEVIRTDATSVLLLPSSNPQDTATLVAQRQIVRWPEMDEKQQRARYIKRHSQYKEYGDIKIIGMYSPEETVRKIIGQLKK
jgi:shikimate kinase